MRFTMGSMEEEKKQELFFLTNQTLHMITEGVYYFRCQNYYRAYALSGQIIDLLQQLVTKLADNGLVQQAESFLPVLKQTLDATDAQDGVLLADLYEEGVSPLLYELGQFIFKQMESGLKDCWGKNRLSIRKTNSPLYRRILEQRDSVPDTYQLSFGKAGDLVLQVQMENAVVCMNSSADSWREALCFVQENTSEEYQEYLVLGFGMGYHIELLARQPYCQKIIVLEHDLNQLAIALSYRDFSDLLDSGKLEIIYCQSPQDYAEWIDGAEERKCCIWYPSVKAISDRELREILENYWLEKSSAENIGMQLEENFRENLKRQDQEISVLRNGFQGKTMILVAGGPSLDDVMEDLRERNSDTILVSVGKVAGKLLRAGIRPDYIVMIDGLLRTRWQINGIESCGVPLIYLSTVAHNVTEDYTGKRYVAYQEGFPMAEEYADEKGYSLYQTGGSVATFALDIGICMGCKKIVCVGLDMGYPGETTHASGVGRKLADTKNLRKVEGITQEYVYTSKTLDIYRRWIEKRIQEEKNIEFINASRGARIHGMKEAELRDVF